MINWLDRLRHSRGFPTTGDKHLDLEHFLATSIPDPAEKSTPPPPVRDERNNGGDGGAGNVVDVLSELFCMGGRANEIPRRKGARKQANPRFVDIHRTADELGKENEIENLNALPENYSTLGFIEGDDDTLIERKDKVEANQMGIDQAPVSNQRHGVDEVEAEGDEEDEFKGYSRLDVTVIDASVPEWKYCRVVYRRKNVWKIRERKVKGIIFGVKKRKAGSLVCRQKNKAGVVLDSIGGSPMEGNSGDRQVPYVNEEEANEGQNETCNGTMDSSGEVAAKRLARSSVILLKAIPVSLNTGGTKPGKRSLKKKGKGKREDSL